MSIIANIHYSTMETEEKNKAQTILKALNGLKLERAKFVLDFCREATENNAIVTIDVSKLT